MRPSCWLLFLALAGCRGIESNPGVTPLAEAKPKLADREAVGKCLPKDLYLTCVIRDCPGGGHPVTLEKALAEVGARVREDGKLCDAAGKEIYFNHLLPDSGMVPIPDPKKEEAERKLREEYLKLREEYCMIDIEANPGAPPAP